MKINHKIFAAILAAILLLLLPACSNTQNQSGTNNNGNSVLKIGIIQVADHEALNQAREGFIKALEENGYKDGENIEISYQNAQNDTNNLPTIADKFVSDNMDLVLAIATPAAQAIAGKTTDIPIIATAVTDFASAGLVNSDEEPGTNVTGTNDMNPIDKQMDLLFELYPDTKTVGFVYNTSEDNSGLQADMAKAYLDQKGIPWVEKTVSTTNDVQQAVTSLVTECDAIYIPTDNILASSMPMVNSITVPAKIPVICGETGMVEKGGLATLGLNYYDLGHKAGLKAVEILKGANVSKIPVEGTDKYDYLFNGEVAEEIGLTIPEKYNENVIYPNK